MSTARGFTLLECLVALAIIAVALMAALRSTGNSTQTTLTLRDHTLAQWVAQNQLALLRAEQGWPPIGRSETETVQGGQRFSAVQTVEPTPNPLFRRVEIQVNAAETGTPLTSLSGFAVRPLR